MSISRTHRQLILYSWKIATFRVSFTAIKTQKISLELKSTLGELLDMCSSWFLWIKIIDAKCFSKRQNLEPDKTLRPMWTENIKVFKLNSWINELRTWKGHGTHNLKTFHSSYSRQLFTSLLFCLFKKHWTSISFGIKRTLDQQMAKF